MSAVRESLGVVIVEDEAPQRQQLRAWLAELPGVRVVGEAADGVAAVAAIDALAPDVVLLDVSLPELSGLEVLARVRQLPDVVFTTAFRDHAVEAFELGAVDYLLKPFGRERLAAALERVHERVHERRLARATDPAPLPQRVAAVLHAQPLERLYVRERNGIVPVAVDDVVRLQADGDYTAVVTAQRRHLVAVPLAALLARIARPTFVRIHRQHAVNLRHVTRCTAHDAARLAVHLTGTPPIVASRAGSQLLRRLVRSG